MGGTALLPSWPALLSLSSFSGFLRPLLSRQLSQNHPSCGLAVGLDELMQTSGSKQWPGAEAVMGGHGAEQEESGSTL